MSVELKIKSINLAQEAILIRRFERKLKKSRNWNESQQHGVIAKSHHDKMCSLSHHRRWVVRNQSRATFLALAFMKGRPYKTVEHKADENFVRYHILPKIVEMVKKYHTLDLGDNARDQVIEWLNA